MRYTNTPSGPEPGCLNPGAGHGAEIHSTSQKDDIINERSASHRRWCWSLPRRAGVLAVAAGVVLLAAACGGGSPGQGASSSPAAASAGPGGASNTGASTQTQQYLAFAECMRSKGMTDFPDPGPEGFPKIAIQLEANPHFVTDFNSCKHLLPEGGESKGQQDAPELLKLALCMHAHSVPSWPEPGGSADPYGDLDPNSSVDLLKVAGVNPNSPVVQAALRVCERGGPEAG
jgi:hypothetical protein